MFQVKKLLVINWLVWSSSTCSVHVSLMSRPVTSSVRDNLGIVKYPILDCVVNVCMHVSLGDWS